MLRRLNAAQLYGLSSIRCKVQVKIYEVKHSIFLRLSTAQLIKIYRASACAFFYEFAGRYELAQRGFHGTCALLGYDYDYLRYWWAGVPHTFESPFYYISYAMSAVPALTIYIDSTSDFTAAAAEYNYIQRYASEYDDFRTLYADAGISDPFTAATYIEIDEYIDKLRGV